MTKDEIKNRISMALKDPILQQGFEIICKNLVELEKENADLVQEKNNLEYKIENLENKVEHHQEVIDTLQKKLERNCTSKGGIDGRT